MKVKIEKSIPRGIISAPPSKSIAHRMLINASLCDSVVKIENLPQNNDISATVECLKTFGNKIEINENFCMVYPRKSDNNEKNFNCGERILNCGESGSTLRFLIPIALLDNIKTTFYCSERLMERPLDEYEKIAKENGFLWQKKGNSLTVKGNLKAGEYYINGNTSSQFLSGIVLALSSVDGTSKIHLLTELESAPYFDLTADSLKTFGIEVQRHENTVTVFGKKRKNPEKVSVEGDYSAVAFFFAMNFLGGDIKIKNLSENSLQGDKIQREIFSQFDAEKPIISVKNCPDLAPVLMALGAAKNGCTLLDTKRLKTKESDRASAMKNELKKFGIECDIFDNSIEVHKGEIHPPEEILYSHNDHRIAMALAILCVLTGGEIDCAQAVEKSLPEFWKMLRQINVKVECKRVF